MIYKDIKYTVPSIEIVERKELGHPDTVCDYLAEEASIFLSKKYMEDYGKILHHNVDKALLVGGETDVWFGGGEMKTPIVFYLAGRAQKIQYYQNELEEHLYKKLFEILPHIKREQFEINLAIRKGSDALINTVEHNIPLSNDTSFGVGSYPLSMGEEKTYNIARFLYDNSLKNKQYGQDIKVMLVKSEKLEVTIAQSFISTYVSSQDEYDTLKAQLREQIKNRFDVEPTINNADQSGGAYLTLTGTSAEAGDDGQVGRGNRINGLITPTKMMTLEAAAGKNPWSHVGKLYQILAQRISKSIYEEKEIKNEVLLVSKIGHPINQPKAIYLKLEKDENIEYIIKYHLEKAHMLYLDILEGKEKVVK